MASDVYIGFCIGKVKHINYEAGYGFINTGSKVLGDVFFHCSECENTIFDDLVLRDEVFFFVDTNEKGFYARHVMLLKILVDNIFFDWIRYKKSHYINLSDIKSGNFLDFSKFLWCVNKTLLVGCSDIQSLANVFTEKLPVILEFSYDLYGLDKEYVKANIFKLFYGSFIDNIDKIDIDNISFSDIPDPFRFEFFYKSLLIRLNNCEDFVQLGNIMSSIPEEYKNNKEILNIIEECLVEKCKEIGKFLSYCIDDDYNKFYSIPECVRENKIFKREAVQFFSDLLSGLACDYKRFNNIISNIPEEYRCNEKIRDIVEKKVSKIYENLAKKYVSGLKGKSYQVCEIEEELWNNSNFTDKVIKRLCLEYSECGVPQNWACKTVVAQSEIFNIISNAECLFSHIPERFAKTRSIVEAIEVGYNKIVRVLCAYLKNCKSFKSVTECQDVINSIPDNLKNRIEVQDAIKICYENIIIDFCSYCQNYSFVLDRVTVERKHDDFLNTVDKLPQNIRDNDNVKKVISDVISLIAKETALYVNLHPLEKINISNDIISHFEFVKNLSLETEYIYVKDINFEKLAFMPGDEQVRYFLSLCYRHQFYFICKLIKNNQMNILKFNLLNVCDKVHGSIYWVIRLVCSLNCDFYKKNEIYTQVISYLRAGVILELENRKAKGISNSNILDEPFSNYLLENDIGCCANGRYCNARFRKSIDEDGCVQEPNEAWCYMHRRWCGNSKLACPDLTQSYLRWNISHILYACWYYEREFLRFTIDKGGHKLLIWDYLGKIGEEYNRFNDLKARLFCSNCGHALIYNFNYSKHSRVFNVTVSNCLNCDDPLNVGIYINRCHNCQKTIDSRECRFKVKNYYICLRCGSSNEKITKENVSRQSCPSCGRKKLSFERANEYWVVCQHCGYHLHQLGAYRSNVPNYDTVKVFDEKTSSFINENIIRIKEREREIMF